jgi:NhaP-type Na+/H+ or K+/H+ antiporter
VTQMVFWLAGIQALTTILATGEAFHAAMDRLQELRSLIFQPRISQVLWLESLVNLGISLILTSLQIHSLAQFLLKSAS